MEDHNLLQTAIDVFSNRVIHRDVGKWSSLHSGVFVTAYFQMPLISENVWCCMSNGEYNGVNSVVENVIQSAQICKTEDSRRFQAPKPNYFEITVLVPRQQWRLVSRLPNGQWDISRERYRAINVSVSGRSAIYLPSVWEERPEWDSATLISELVQKAGGDSNDEIIVHEIGVYDISDRGSINSGYFDNNSENFDGSMPSSSLIDEILKDAWKFYTTFASNNQLAYMVDSSGVYYNNEGANVRTYFDVSTFCKLSQYFGNPDFTFPYAISVLNRIQPQTTVDLAARINLLLDVGMSETQELIQFVNETANHEGIFVNTDLSFGNPQIMITLLRIANAIPEVQDIVSIAFKGFVSNYRKVLPRILNENRAFAANWILQALSKGPHIYDDLLPSLFTECQKALINPDSITLEACALNGLLIFKQNIDINPILNYWRELQKQWKIGGFRYYTNQPWYRTDVTSHVVEDCLLIVLN
jgi:hypothetical protein